MRVIPYHRVCSPRVLWQQDRVGASVWLVWRRCCARNLLRHLQFLLVRSVEVCQDPCQSRALHVVLNHVPILGVVLAVSVVVVGANLLCP